MKPSDMEYWVSDAFGPAVTQEQVAGPRVLFHAGQLHRDGSIDKCIGTPAEDVTVLKSFLVGSGEVIDA